LVPALDEKGIRLNSGAVPAAVILSLVFGICFWYTPPLLPIIAKAKLGVLLKKDKILRNLSEPGCNPPSPKLRRKKWEGAKRKGKPEDLPTIHFVAFGRKAKIRTSSFYLVLFSLTPIVANG
jgi:hypothetical protein